MSGMCHLGDELYFGRKADGSVRLLQLLPGGSHSHPDIDTVYVEATYDRTFTRGEWEKLSLGCAQPRGQKATLQVFQALVDGLPLSEELVEAYNREDGE